jgi:hypothetical protein
MVAHKGFEMTLDPTPWWCDDRVIADLRQVLCSLEGSANS